MGKEILLKTDELSTKETQGIHLSKRYFVILGCSFKKIEKETMLSISNSFIDKKKSKINFFSDCKANALYMQLVERLFDKKKIELLFLIHRKRNTVRLKTLSIVINLLKNKKLL